MRYVAGIKDNGNAAMWRGTAVETGLGSLLRRDGIQEAVCAAWTNFDLNALGVIDDDVDAERALIEPMLHQLEKWKAPSQLNATQLRVEYFFDPVPIPCIGYIDLCFDGVDIDLKTTKALPSKPRTDNVRQVALYRKTRGRDGGLLYVTDKKHIYHPVTDEMMDEAIEDLHAAALTLNNFLARMDTKEDVLRSLPFDYDHFQAPKMKVPLSELLLAG